MLKTVEGIFQDGQIKFTELPKDVSNHTQVLVTFLDTTNIDPAKLRQLLDQIETIAGIQQGIDELNAGKTRPINQFIEEMQEKYNVLY